MFLLSLLTLSCSDAQWRPRPARPPSMEANITGPPPHPPVGTYPPPPSFHPRFPITQTLPPSLPTPPRPLFPLSPVMMKLLLEKTKGKPSTSSSFSHRFSRGWKKKKRKKRLKIGRERIKSKKKHLVCTMLLVKLPSAHFGIPPGMHPIRLHPGEQSSF